jgi:adenylosuccinate synthase
MASGKTSVSAVLQECFKFLPISSSAFLRGQLAARNEPPDRLNLQEFGDSLDRATNFSWLIESVAKPAIDGRPDADNWLLDAVRKSQQVELFRLSFGNALMHVHFVAAESVLQQRYAKRGPSHLAEYQACVRHPNEQNTRSLGRMADKVFDTGTHTTAEIANQIMELWER